MQGFADMARSFDVNGRERVDDSWLATRRGWLSANLLGDRVPGKGATQRPIHDARFAGSARASAEPRLPSPDHASPRQLAEFVRRCSLSARLVDTPLPWRQLRQDWRDDTHIPVPNDAMGASSTNDSLM